MTMAAASLLVGILFFFNTDAQAQAPDVLARAKAAYASAAFEEMGICDGIAFRNFTVSESLQARLVNPSPSRCL